MLNIKVIHENRHYARSCSSDILKIIDDTFFVLFGGWEPGAAACF